MSSNQEDETALEALKDEITNCFRCPRLVEWRERIAVERRASFANEVYWGKPVGPFGDVRAQLIIVGLAPAAHGGNRTGRMFTGDRSGEWLYRALYKAGYANQAISTTRDDGLILNNAYITAAVKCAPPANKPTVEERNLCVETFLRRELAQLPNRVVTLCLGKFAFDVVASVLGLTRRPDFGHGVEVKASDNTIILGSFHPSQQNTFTKKLTEPMFDQVFARTKEIISHA